MGTYKYLSLFLYIFLVIQVQTYAEQNNIEKTGSLEINLTNQEITDKFINLSYEIKNTSNEDIWLCEACDLGNYIDYELFLKEDGQTIVIRRQTDIPLEGIYRNPPLAQYVRL